MGRADDRGWRGVVDDEPPRTLFDAATEHALLREETIEEQFQSFHAAHPEVYDHLRKLALRMVRRGHKRLGIGMLWEVLRWRTMLGARPDEDDGQGWKLNNNYRSRYARLLADQVPELADVFHTRELTAS
jgi:hypothetical protein